VKQFDDTIRSARDYGPQDRKKPAPATCRAIWEDGMKRALLAMVSAACIALGGASAQAQGQVSDQAGQDPGALCAGRRDRPSWRASIGEQLRIILGQSFVVENKPGAFGILAVEEMSRAKPTATRS